MLLWIRGNEDLMGLVERTVMVLKRATNSRPRGSNAWPDKERVHFSRLTAVHIGISCHSLDFGLSPMGLKVWGTAPFLMLAVDLPSILHYRLSSS